MTDWADVILHAIQGCRLRHSPTWRDVARAIPDRPRRWVRAKCRKAVRMGMLEWTEDWDESIERGRGWKDDVYAPWVGLREPLPPPPPKIPTAAQQLMAARWMSQEAELVAALGPNWRKLASSEYGTYEG